MLKFKRLKPDELLHIIVDRFHLNENTVILILASAVGIIGGFGAIGFRELIGALQTLTIGSSDNILNAVIGLPWYKKLLLPVIGGFIVGPLIYFFGKETKGHGVPEVMEAVALRSGKIRTRVMFLKAFVSALTIATGGSVGREGPIVQIGSSLGSAFGHWLRVSKERMKILVASGAAAGIAATFNAPLAGVLFSVEIILGNYAIVTLLPLILSSVLATIVGRWYFGNVPAFEIPHYALSSGWEIGPYFFLGLGAGIIAIIFIKCLYFFEDTADKISIKSWLKTPIILSLLGIMILFFPHIYGVGYDTISLVLKGEYIWYMLLLLIPVKIIATSVTLAAGGSGGIFAPSLFIGAVFGGFFGSVLNVFFPEIVPTPEAFAVVGMSAVVAGTTHAPITGFLVIFEMTGDYKLILPLMMCSIISSFVASSLHPDSIYTKKLSRRGVDLSRGLEVSIMQATKVKDIMHRDMIVFKTSTGFHELLQQVITSNQACFYVIDEDDRFQGTFSVHDVKEIIAEEVLEGVVVAHDLISLTASPFITEDASLADCMRKFSLYDMDELAVIDNDSSMRLIGRVSRRDIITLYDREILRQGALGFKFIQSKPTELVPPHSYIDLPEDFEVHLVTINRSLIGKTLQELDVRHTYGVTVVAINRRGESGEREVIIPDPDLILKRGYMLIVIGNKKNLKHFKESFHLSSTQ